MDQLTEEQIRSMPAGRELDVLVAERVMGWTNCSQDYQIRTSSRPGAGYPPGSEFPHDLPFYSTEIAAAWDVVEHFKRRELHLRWVAGDPAYYTCVFGESAYGNAEKAPLAICLAALLAVKNG